MQDDVFVQAVYWLFLQHSVVLTDVVIVTTTSALVTILAILRRWGEGY